jgi:uncharacterized iron-regulated protein
MRLISIFFSILLTSSLIAADPVQLFTGKGKKVDFDKLIKATEGKSHLFFGEFHDCALGHWFQLELTKSLYDRHKENLLIAFEMFEADNQLIIDEYLSGKISTKNFEDECRLWTNYKTDYKPIVEFMKTNQIPLIAANIPRRYANSVFHNGLEHLVGLSEEAKRYIAPLPVHVDSTIGCYREIMKMGAGGHKGERMMHAQAIKDATMAHFILKFSKPGKIILHLNGSFHSNNYEGVPSFVKAHIPQENMLTITMVSQDKLDKLDEENIDLADFIFVFPSDYAKSH